ncbi:MYLK3 kinase, partial [Polyodon spathula]|nr:MYLK3 kinase [Polyodon spathula]
MQPPRATASEDNAALGSLQASPQVPGQTTGVAGAWVEFNVAGNGDCKAQGQNGQADGTADNVEEGSLCIEENKESYHYTEGKYITVMRHQPLLLNKSSRPLLYTLQTHHAATQSYSVRGQRSPGQLTGKPAGAWPDHRGRWCMKKETGAKPKAEFCNRAIQAEIGRSPEDDTGVKKQPTKTDELVNSALQSQSDNQVDESPLAPVTSTEVLTETKSSELVIASAKHIVENKLSRKPREVTIKSREPTRTQTFIKETHDVGVNTDDHDAPDCQKEEITIAVITGETQTPAPAAKPELNEATATSPVRHPDNTHTIPSELQRKPSLAEQGAPSTTQQQEEAAQKSSENDIKGAKKPQAEKKEVCKSSKSTVPLIKNKDTRSEKDPEVPVTPLKGTPPTKTQNEQKIQASETQNTNHSVKKNKAEKLTKIESPNNCADPVQQTEPEKKTSATETNVELETKAEGTSDTKAVLNAKPQKTLRVIIDDSPSQPAPFEHRIVSAKHMAVTSYYSLIQNELLGG